MGRGWVAAGAIAIVLAGTEAGAEERTEAPLREARALGLLARLETAATGMSPAARRQVAASIVREARAAGLDPLLVAAVIEVESAFRPEAVSPVGAIGLMQVMPATGAWLAERFGKPELGGRRHLFEPEWNVHLGVRYLAELIRQFGRLEHALVAYNAGPNRAQRVLAGETRGRWLAGYPRKVLEARERFRQEAARLAAVASGDGPAVGRVAPGPGRTVRSVSEPGP